MIPFLRVSLVCIFFLLLAFCFACGGGSSGSSSASVGDDFRLPVPIGEPTPVPTASPTPSPTTTPSPSPTISPTSSPSPSPTTSPTSFPSPRPTVAPTSSPSPSPTPTATPPPQDSALEPNLRSLPERAWADDRWLVFATDERLLPTDTNDHSDIYLRDLLRGELFLVTRNSDGPSTFPSISTNGQKIVFLSRDSSLAEGSDDEFQDVLVYDRRTKLFRNLTKEGTSDFSQATISGDGKLVAAVATEPGLAVGERSSNSEVFLFDLESHEVSLRTAHQTGDAVSPSLDHSGRGLAYGAKHSGFWQIFVQDTQENLEAIASQSLMGHVGNGDSFLPSFEQLPTPRLVFQSSATNLHPNGPNVIRRIYRTAVGQMDILAEGEAPVLSRDGEALVYLRNGQGFLRLSLEAETSLGQLSEVTVSSRTPLWIDHEGVKARAVSRNGPTLKMEPGFRELEVHQQQVWYSDFHFSRDVLHSDLDGNGRLDVVGLSNTNDIRGSTRLLVALSDEFGSFQRLEQNLGRFLRGFTLADLNNDGRQDLVFLSSRCQPTDTFPFSTTVYTLDTALNDGNGNFLADFTVDLPSLQSYLAVGNLDLQAGHDVVVWNSWANPPVTARVYLSDGLGDLNLSPHTVPVPTDYRGQSLLLCDVDGDGLDDVVFIDDSEDALAVCLNLGLEGFSSPILTPFGERIRAANSQLAAYDSNHNGRQDVLVSTSAGSVSLWRSQGGGSLVLDRSFSAPLGHVQVADLDQDGRQDWIVSSSSVTTIFPDGEEPSKTSPGLNQDVGFQLEAQGPSAIVRAGTHLVRIERVEGFFGLPLELEGETVFWLAGDVDGDLLPDLVAVQQGQVVVRKGTLDGDFGASVVSVIEELELATLAEGAALEDLNGNGHLDLVLPLEAGVVTCFGQGDGTFLFGETLLIPNSGALRLAVADLDQDGFPDLVYGRLASNLLGILTNSGDGSFSDEPQILTLGAQLRGFSLGDADGDGRLDLGAVTTANALELFLADQPGQFTSPVVQTLDPSSLSASLIFRDINGDGLEELLFEHAVVSSAVAFFGCSSFPLEAYTPPPSLSATPLLGSRDSGSFWSWTTSLQGYLSGFMVTNEIAYLDFDPYPRRLLFGTDATLSVQEFTSPDHLNEVGRHFIGRSLSRGFVQKDFNYDGRFQLFLPRSFGFSWLER